MINLWFSNCQHEKIGDIMDEASWQQSNPWADDDATLGTVRNVITLALNTGHMTKRDLVETEMKLEQGKDLTPSMRMLKLIEQADQCRRSIDKANLEIHKRLQDKETRDLTHTDVLEKRIDRIRKLNNHLQHIISSKDQLISRLQQPFVGDFLKLDAAYHRYASEVFPEVAPLLAELSTHLVNIDWASSGELTQGTQERILAELTSNLAALQTRFQQLQQLRSKVQQHLNS